MKLKIKIFQRSHKEALERDVTEWFDNNEIEIVRILQSSDIIMLTLTIIYMEEQ